MRLLIKLGLIVVPFYELLIRFLPYAIPATPDTRLAKEAIALWIALAIGLLAVSNGLIKKINNIFLFFCVFSFLVSIKMAPPISFSDSLSEGYNFWMWKPTIYAISYLLMVVGIASVDFSDRKIGDGILKSMMYCGLIMSGYVVLQYLGYDQFYFVRTREEIGAVGEANIVGNLGQPTILAPFIAMLIPLAFYFKKYIYVGLMCVALILANSQVAWIALILAMVFYLCMIRPRITPVAITIILLVYIGGSLYITSKSAYKELMNDNGRFPVWKMTMSDIKSGALNEMKADYSMTGLGPGAFGHVFPFAHKSVFKQAHNDYLEFWYNNGFLGIGSLLLAMIMMFKIAWGKFIKYADYRKTRIAALLSSFIVIAICAFGTFVWQLGAHIFYTCVLVGLIHNETI